MSDSDPGTLGSRLRYARDLSGLGSRELGRLAGVSEGYPSNIESGARKNVPIEALSGFARVLGLSLDWLVDGQGDPPSRAAVVIAAEKARQDWKTAHPGEPHGSAA